MTATIQEQRQGQEATQLPGCVECWQWVLKENDGAGGSLAWPSTKPCSAKPYLNVAENPGFKAKSLFTIKSLRCVWH